MFYIDQCRTQSIPIGLMLIIFLALADLTCHLRLLEYVFSGCTLPSDSKETELESSDYGIEFLQLFLRYPSVICYNRQVLNEGHKNYFKNWCLMNSQPTFLFFSEFKLIELWPYYQKHVNQIITSDASICSTMAFPPIGKF